MTGMGGVAGISTEQALASDGRLTPLAAAEASDLSGADATPLERAEMVVALLAVGAGSASGRRAMKSLLYERSGTSP